MSRFYVPLPELNGDLSRVIISGNLHADVSRYLINDILKMDFMVQDLRILEEFTPLDTYIIDCANTTIHHYAKYTLPLLFKLRNIVLVSFFFFLWNLRG